LRLARFEQGEFVEHRFDWNRGEHLFASEPTQQGKTYILYRLADKVLRDHEDDVSFASLMPKPGDPTTRDWMARLELRETPVWPPLPRLPFRRKPRGYVLWPPHLRDAEASVNREHVGAIMRGALNHQYWTGNSLTLADDAHVLAALMKANPELEQTLTAGAGLGSAVWVASQKPSGSKTGSLTSFAYSAPTHLLFGHDPYEANLQRLSEIGGVNPELIASIVKDLPLHRIMTPQGPKNVSEKLYIHKLGYMCIVGL
jgi:hypothetical protein